MMQRIALIAVCALVVAGCAPKNPPKGTIAVAGDRWIDTTELNRSYVLQPQWKRGQTRLESYLTQVSELITQKLYAQEAEARGLDRDSLMLGYLGFLKQKEMIKGLYRREISGKVQISEAEVRQMYERMKKKIDFSYVYARDSVRCAEYLGALKSKQLPVAGDSSVRVGTKEDVAVGMVAPELEPLVFDAGLNDVRGPIRVGNGYIAVRITGGERDVMLSDNDLIQQRRKIERLISDRQMDVLSSRYVAGLMRDKDLRLNAPVFWGVADCFGQRVQEEHIDSKQMQTVYVTSDELRLLGADLQLTGNAVVATYRDGTLTVRELLEALSNMPGSLRPRVRTPQNLKDAIGGIVRNRYLLKEAERQGLADDPEVLSEYAMQRDEALANAYYAHRRAAISVTPEEVEAFKKHSAVSEEQVFFKMNMSALARDAKVDSILKGELPVLRARREIRCDTVKIRAMVPSPDEVLRENPVRLFLRELFM
jgi:hypothetical protein